MNGPDKYQNAYRAEAEAKGHTLILDDDGEVDWFVVSSDGHNGTGCSTCGWSACLWCDSQHDNWQSRIPTCSKPA